MRTRLILMIILGLMILSQKSLASKTANFKLEKLFTVAQDSPLKIHVFSNDNFAYLNNENELLFKTTEREISYGKFETGKYFLNISFEMLADNIFITDNKDAEFLKMLDNQGKLFKLPLGKYDEILNTLTFLTKDQVVFYEARKLSLYSISQNKYLWSKKYSFDIHGKIAFNKEYLVTTDGIYLLVFSRKNGELKWKKRINKDYSQTVGDYPDGIWNICVTKNKIFFININFVYCINLNDGKVLWKKKKSATQWTNVFLYKDLYVVDMGDLVAFDVNSGKIIWRLDMDFTIRIKFKNYIMAEGLEEEKYKNINLDTGKVMYRNMGIKFGSYDSFSFEASRNNLYFFHKGTVYKVKF